MYKKRNTFKPKLKICYTTKNRVWFNKNSKFINFYNFRRRIILKRNRFYKRYFLKSKNIKWTLTRRFMYWNSLNKIRSKLKRNKNRKKHNFYKDSLYSKQQLKKFYGKTKEKDIIKLFIKNWYSNKKWRQYNFFFSLERRLDIILYRLRFLPTIYSCNQYITFNGLLVNDILYKRPHLNTSVGDIISFRLKHWSLFFSIYENKLQHRKLGFMINKKRNLKKFSLAFFKIFNNIKKKRYQFSYNDIRTNLIIKNKINFRKKNQVSNKSVRLSKNIRPLNSYKKIYPSHSYSLEINPFFSYNKKKRKKDLIIHQKRKPIFQKFKKSELVKRFKNDKSNSHSIEKVFNIKSHNRYQRLQNIKLHENIRRHKIYLKKTKPKTSNDIKIPLFDINKKKNKKKTKKEKLAKKLQSSLYIPFYFHLSDNKKFKPEKNKENLYSNSIYSFLKKKKNKNKNILLFKYLKELYFFRLKYKTKIRDKSIFSFSKEGYLYNHFFYIPSYFEMDSHTLRFGILKLPKPEDIKYSFNCSLNNLISFYKDRGF